MEAPFTIKPLTSYKAPSELSRCLDKMGRSLGYLLLGTAFFSLVYCLSPLARAESFDYSPLPEKKITLRFPEGKWHLPGGTDHQNHVLRLCQDRLKKDGLPDEAIKYGCSILLAENERMDPLRTGDGGQSFGICQRYLKGQSAKRFLDQNPEWKTLEKQIDYCMGRFTDAYKKYGNVFQATVQHNCPACAARNQDAYHIKPPYFQRVKLATAKLEAL